MELWTCLETLRKRHDVLNHPFYRRWSAGELTPGELARYAGQYRHAVVALAQASARAAARARGTVDPELCARLEEHAAEEARHVALWDQFAVAVGGTVDAAPSARTTICARTWAGDGERALLPSLMALHAIEAGQPAIAATKRAGLLAHYGVQDGPATAYFKLHERLDAEHARLSRRSIEAVLGGPRGELGPGARAEAADAAMAGELLGEAEAVLRANWLLLDGVAADAVA